MTTGAADDPLIEVEVSLVFPGEAILALARSPVDGLAVSRTEERGTIVYRGRKSVVVGYLTSHMGVDPDNLEEMTVTVDGNPVSPASFKTLVEIMEGIMPDPTPAANPPAGGDELAGLDAAASE